MAYVDVKGVTKDYKIEMVKVQALRGVDLAVEKGDFVAIAGPSGSGKTTLLNLIGCLDTPTSGEVLVEDEPIGKLSKTGLSDLRRRKIGFIFQSFNLIPVLTAQENVAFAAHIVGGKMGEQAEDLAREALAIVGLEGMESRFPRELSGGQQQRVAVARALVKEPSLVLADEPTANLDSVTASEILKLMDELNKKIGATFVFSTHDPMVMDHSRRLVKLHDGRVSSDERK